MSASWNLELIVGRGRQGFRRSDISKVSPGFKPRQGDSC